VQATLRSWFETDGSLKSNLRVFACVFVINFVGVMSLTFALYFLNFEFLFVSDLIGDTSKLNKFVLFFLVAFVGPAIEEYIFRYPALIVYRGNKERSKYAFMSVLLISSLIFSLTHSLGAFKFPLPQFITGASLFFVGSRTNIFYCIAFHMLHNFLALLIAEFP
jgi:membrane protease YdiL (CAAX protease family)